jgi:hypothetical protein
MNEMLKCTCYRPVIHNVYDVSDGYFNHGCGKSGVAVSLQSGVAKRNLINV